MPDVAELTLVAKILELHSRFESAGVGHAFGGALALAYYTPDPRATADVDVNIELPADSATIVFEALPSDVVWTDADLTAVSEREQVRLWWGRTPVDLFFRASEFHELVATRTATHDFAGTMLPFLSANDLATFKAMFNRPKDWLDIATMVAAGTVELSVVIKTIVTLLGDGREAERLRAIEVAG